MAPRTSFDAILSIFDDSVAKGLVKYTTPKTFRVEDGGFTFEFQISPALSKKPQDGDPISGHEHGSEKPECFGPGSDIAVDHPSLLITTVRDTHLLVVNKFCISRPQLLLLTRDSYRRQWEPLGLEDLAAACTVLGSLDHDLYVIYNCGPMAGSSRRHKHLQVLPRPGQLFPDSQGVSGAVPYRYFLRYLNDVDLGSSDGQTRLFEIYSSLLAEAKKSLGDNLDNDGYIPHNVALVKEWIIVIPRRNGAFEDITANTAGMLGSVWMANEEEIDRWKQVGPKRVLAGLSVPGNF
ncbi:ATP adenylyltransferase-domain-containing protein [Aspergillus egyptiacus]|nr:ATP adenylyltransferase-domain-containing protein [Aspergillus egyptiacus]